MSKTDKGEPGSGPSIDRRRFLGASAAGGAALAVPGITRATASRRWGISHRPVIIIGSGFGGAISAWRLAQNGIPSTIIEKGQRWDQPLAEGETRFSPNLPPDGRSTWMSFLTSIPLGPPLPIQRRPGVLEGRNLARFRVMSAAAYGGGSIVYGGVQVKPEKRIFEQVFPPELSFDALQPYYDRVSSILGRSTVPEDVLQSDNFRHVRVAERHCDRAGVRCVRVETATDWDIVRQEINGEVAPSVIVGEAVYGVNSGAKATLDNTYLAFAEEAGMLEVKALSEVLNIGALPGGRYFVDVIERNEHGHLIGRHLYTCDSLFLSAGCVGSTSLLVRARATGLLPELNEHVGRGFGNNGNVYTLRVGPEPTGQWHAGPPSLGIDDLDNPETPLFVEHPQLPLGIELRTLLYFGIGLTPTRGHFYYDSATRQVRLAWPRGPDSGQDRVNRGLLATMARLNEANGGRSDSLISALLFDGKTFKDDAIYHPLGGCVMGKACDFFGRVKNYSGLYVNDGALMPGSSACTNPSLTISAIAERNIERIIAEDF